MENKVTEIIKEIRKSKGITQLEMAEKLGMTQGGYQAIESNRVPLTLNKLADIAEVFGMHIIDLIEYPEVDNIKKDVLEQNKIIEEIGETIKDLESRLINIRISLIQEHLINNELRIQLKEIDLEKAINEGVSQETISYIKETIEFYKNEIVINTALLKSFGLKEITINVSTDSPPTR